MEPQLEISNNRRTLTPPPRIYFFYQRMTLLYVNNLQINLFVYLA